MHCEVEDLLFSLLGFCANGNGCIAIVTLSPNLGLQKEDQTRWIQTSTPLLTNWTSKAALLNNCAHLNWWELVTVWHWNGWNTQFWLLDVWSAVLKSMSAMWTGQYLPSLLLYLIHSQNDATTQLCSLRSGKTKCKHACGLFSWILF